MCKHSVTVLLHLLQQNLFAATGQCLPSAPKYFDSVILVAFLHCLAAASGTLHNFCSLSQLTELNINSNTPLQHCHHNINTHYATSLPQANLFGGRISINSCTWPCDRRLINLSFLVFGFREQCWNDFDSCGPLLKVYYTYDPGDPTGEITSPCMNGLSHRHDPDIWDKC